MMDRQQLLIPLDFAQSEAAEATDRNLLVVAGPGAGKTRLITGRIQQLLQQGDAEGRTVAPHDLCCITFTNKACAEIRSRLREQFPAEAEEIVVRTFHGLARDILREFPDSAGLPKHFHIIDDVTQGDILAFALRKHQFERDPALLRRLKTHLDLEKGQLRFPLQHPKAQGPATEYIPRLFSYYQRFLAEQGVIDFNDLLLAALQVLITNPMARETWHRRCRHLLLDEFQDVNEVQYELVKCLAGPETRVLAVADGNQMIYGWRGSDSRFLEAFRADFAAAELVLGRNYRADEELQVLGRTLIAHNDPRRKTPTIPADLTNKAASLFYLLDEEEEVRTVERIIQAAQKHDPSLTLNDIAILSRTHGISERLERDLALAGIPVQRVRRHEEDPEGGLERLISYLRLALHLFDWDLYRAMEYPRKLLSPLENLALNEEHQRKGVTLLDLLEGELPPSISPLSRHKLARFAQLVRELHHTHLADTPSQFFRHLVASLGEFRSPFSEEEELLLLEEALARVDRPAEFAPLRAFLKEQPTGRLLLVHGGTVTGALAGLVALEATKGYLGRTSAVVEFAALTIEEIQRLLGAVKHETLVLTLGLTPGQARQLEGRLAEAGLSGEALHWIPQATVSESFDLVFETYTRFAWFLAKAEAPLQREVVFLDLETTGVEIHRCQLLQLAAQRVNLATGQVTGELNTYLRPTEHIPSKVTEITGITEAMVASAPSAAEVLPAFWAFLGDSPVAGHNVQGFDLAILRRYTRQMANRDLPNLAIDTWLWSKELLPRQNHSQEALCARFGLHPPEGAGHHRADVDVDLNRQLFPHLERLDHLKRGLLFSQVALVLTALASYQDEGIPTALKLAVREGAKRILQRVEQDDRDIAMLIGRHFEEFQAARLLTLVKQLGTEPLADDPQQDRFERHVAAIQEQMLRYEDAHTDSEGIRGFLDFYYLLNDQDYLDGHESVKMLTVHAAKGLEFEVVIIVGMEQGSFPHYLAVNHLKRIEEERRLLYVALTRARRKVYLTAVKTRAGKFRPPSMFLRELPAQLVRTFKTETVATPSKGRAA